MSKQRQKGTYFVTQICLPLIARFYPGATQAPAWGSNDKGDVILPGETRFILEMKNEKTMKLAGWVKEAQAEAINADVAFGIVVHKRLGTQDPEEQYVTMTLGDFLRLVS